MGEPKHPSYLKAFPPESFEDCWETLPVEVRDAAVIIREMLLQGLGPKIASRGDLLLIPTEEDREVMLEPRLKIYTRRERKLLLHCPGDIYRPFVDILSRRFGSRGRDTVTHSASTDFQKITTEADRAYEPYLQELARYSVEAHARYNGKIQTAPTLFEWKVMRDKYYLLGERWTIRYDGVAHQTATCRG